MKLKHESVRALVRSAYGKAAEKNSSGCSGLTCCGGEASASA